jgi:cell division protein FtsZ
LEKAVIFSNLLIINEQKKGEAMFELEEIKNDTKNAKIKVIGVGGAGCNAINSMVEADLRCVEFISINTDLQSLDASLVENKIQIGASLTKGLGAGANPEIGRQAAIDDAEVLRDAIEGADMVFITAGMGGGTGTGASPVIGEIATELGILTAAVVTKPFIFEGKKRAENCYEGINDLKKHVDVVIVIENNKLLSIVEPSTPILETFKVANNVLRYAVQGISDTILVPGLINLDFADVKTIMASAGRAVMGIGRAEGEERAIEAARMAISSPLLEEMSIEGAKGVLINITGGSTLTLHEVNDASSLIHSSAHNDAHIIFGAVIDPNIDNEIMVTVIATGFDDRIPSAEDIDTESEGATEREGKEAAVEEKVKDVDSDDQGNDLDIPTFLRKQRKRMKFF